MQERKTMVPTCDCEVIHDDIVERVRSELGNDTQSTPLATFFKLFSDPTRIRLLRALLIQEMCVCDLAVLLGVTKSAVSHQLKALKLLNVVRFRREGQVVFYALADSHVAQILSLGLEHISEGTTTNPQIAK